MNLLTLSLLMVGIIWGKKLIIKTNKKHYLARTKHDKIGNTGSDYENPPWLDPCSLKKGKGEMKQKDVVGCGGGISKVCRRMSANI